MVLVSLLLVLAAAVALVVGLLQSGLAIIYVSIGCSVVAGVLLAVAVVRGKPERVSSGPMPQPAAPPAPEPSAAAPSWQSSEAAPEPEREREPVMAGAGARHPGSAGETQQLDQAAIELAVRGDDDDGPIPDYDRLRATEVLPLLADLDAAQLAQVRAQEVGGRNRFMVLSRIDRELEARGPADAEEEPETSDGEWDRGDDWGGSAETGAGSDDEVDIDGAPDDQYDEDYEEEPAAVFAAPAAGSSSILDNYEQLKVLEILPRLGELNADELAQVRRREQAGQRRAMIINRVDRLIVDAQPAPTARPARAVRSTPPAPARRGRATKTTAKKAPAAAPAAKTTARKAPAKKVAATRAAAKKAAAKAPAKAAMAKKVAAKKAPAKKAPAKKVVARTSTPAEKRGASVRKTTRATKKR